MKGMAIRLSLFNDDLFRMAAPTREQVAEQFAQVARIVDATVGAPTIINPESRFVVVTYWWGRGRQNFNTARPCGEFHESLLMKPIHMLTPATAMPDKFRSAISGNANFNEFLEKKIRDHLGMVAAHIKQGKPLSPIHRDLDAKALKQILKRIILRYVETVLPLVQEYQRVFVERADLEDSFRRRVAAGRTSPAQLETIRARLDELKAEKEDYMRQIKGRMGPFKSAMDRTLRYQEPLTYDGMIAEWEATCARARCNYMAIEYPEFAAPGGYQLAINAKPRFIKKALELCRDRGVLYIDGDMTVNKYPAIFDMPDVDLMARGWNVDPRSSYKFRESIMIDPYTFETSGGIMFYGNTPEAALLLEKWIEVSEQYSQWGKADDRILSLVFNTYKLLLPLKVIQLPVEYLWLTLDFDDNLEDIMDRDAIYVEHPECLTSEETATGQGASSSRTPKFYEVIEDSYPRSEYLHEAVLFPTQELTSAFRPYLDYLHTARYFPNVEDETLVGEQPFHVVPFEEGLGPFQAVADANAAAVAALPPLTGVNAGGMLEIRENDATTVPRILQALAAGVHVKYLPPTATAEYLESLETTLARFPRIEFAFANASTKMQRNMFFNSVFNVAEPAFFRAGCPHLQQLLSACSSLTELSAFFRNAYQFLSRIRTHFLKKYRRAAAAAAATAAQSAGGNVLDSEDALEFLYGAKALTGGQRKQRTQRSLSKRRNTRRRKRAGVVRNRSRRYGRR